MTNHFLRCTGRVITAGVAVLLLAPQLHAQPKEDRSVSLTIENDTFFGGTDSSYTNGIRLSWDLLRANRVMSASARVLTLEGAASRFVPGLRQSMPLLACEVHEAREQGTRNCMTMGFSLAQTMFTPSNIVDPAPQYGARPYAGMLFASAYVTRLRVKAQYATEVQLGVVGPASFSEHTQSLAHWTFSSGAAKPRGWDNQLRNRVHVGLVNTYMYRWGEKCLAGKCNGSIDERRVFDFTPRVEGTVGTHMVRGTGGAMLRLGYKFPDAVGLTRIPTTAAANPSRSGPAFWWNAFVSADQRVVAHNTFITGKYPFMDDRWDSVRTIGLKRLVHEVSYGGVVGLRRGTVSVQMINRSSEYAPAGGGHVFGSLTFTLFTPMVAN